MAPYVGYATLASTGRVRDMYAEAETIADIGYDETHEKLFVRFADGAEHMYVGVPPQVHRSFAETDGKDRFFREEVSGCYPYNQLPA